jgi:hypothetical protein
MPNGCNLASTTATSCSREPPVARANGQKLKCLTIVAEWTRDSLAIDVAGSFRFEARIRPARKARQRPRCAALHTFRQRARDRCHRVELSPRSRTRQEAGERGGLTGAAERTSLAIRRRPRTTSISAPGRPDITRSTRSLICPRIPRCRRVGRASNSAAPCESFEVFAPPIRSGSRP